MGGNVFDDDDKPTLAGRVIVSVYTELLKRHGMVHRTPEQLDRDYELARQSNSAYFAYIEGLNRQRAQEGRPELEAGSTRRDGTDAFHTDGSAGAARDFMFYFNKAHAHWKNPRDQEVRAYITLSPSEKQNIYKHFTDLAILLYDQGIDFSAKAASPYMMEERTDDMVFYISNQDQARASVLIKQFLEQRQIASGHVMAAVPSPQDGLSWALEPGKIQTQTWQEVSGSSQRASYNVYVATRIMPVYLERLAVAQERLGNRAEAAEFRQEALRVRLVIELLEASAQAAARLQKEKGRLTAGERRVTLADTLDKLPPIKPGYIRVVHGTAPQNVDKILEDGLDYSAQGMLMSTARVIDSNKPLDIGTDDVRFNNGEYVVMDIPATEIRLYNNISRHPGVVDPGLIVGVVPASLVHQGESPVLELGKDDLVSEQEIEETKKWVAGFQQGSALLPREAQEPDLVKTELEKIAYAIRRETKALNDKYSGTLPPLAPLPSWQVQTNPQGMFTCQFASAGNALRALGVYDQNRHSEQAFIDAQHSPGYARNHQNGANSGEVMKALGELAPEVEFRRSNSVSEILNAVENGAAVIILPDPAHAALIPPGSRVSRDAQGKLAVQTIDPIRGERMLPLEDLLKSDITISVNPLSSPAIIINKK